MLHTDHKQAGDTAAATLPHGLPDTTAAMLTCDDEPAVFAEALAAAIAQGLDAPIVVVDMSRGAAVREICAAQGDAVRYVAARDSRGLSDSRNRAIAAAGTRYVLFLDADAIAQPGWAAAMRAAFDRTDGVAVVGARCVARWGGPPPRLFQTQFAGDFLSLFDLGGEAIDVPRIVGTSHAIDRERLPATPYPLELGFGLDSDLGGEEVALCERARADGWRVRYEPTAIVLHSIPARRATWRSMLRRAYDAGRESRRDARRLEPLPRRALPWDRAFQAAIAPAFLVGALRG